MLMVKGYKIRLTVMVKNRGIGLELRKTIMINGLV